MEYLQIIYKDALLRLPEGFKRDSLSTLLKWMEFPVSAEVYQSQLIGKCIQSNDRQEAFRVVNFHFKMIRAITINKR